MNKCLYPSKATSRTESETGFVVTEAKLDNDFRAFGAVMTCRMVNVDAFSPLLSNPTVVHTSVAFLFVDVGTEVMARRRSSSPTFPGRSRTSQNFTLPHLFRSDSGRTARTPRNPSGIRQNPSRVRAESDWNPLRLQQLLPFQ